MKLERYHVCYMNEESKQLRDDTFTVDNREMFPNANTFRVLAAGYEFTHPDNIAIHGYELIEGP